MKTTTQSTADFYSTINSLARFLLREKESGYVFAVAEDERILPEIFQTLRSKAAGKGKNLLFIRLLPESEQSILQQLLNALETQPGVEAVSVSGLDELLEKKTGTGQLTRNGKNRLLELNFARERLNELGRPIVFWVSPGNQTLLANQAADLFGQRRLSTTRPGVTRGDHFHLSKVERFLVVGGEAVIRIRRNNNAYQMLEGAVSLDEQTLFRTSINLPSNLTEGAYTTRIFLTRAGRVVSEYDTVIDVRKVGLERWLFTLSREQPMLYGLMSLAIAIAAGWGASAAFQVLRRG